MNEEYIQVRVNAFGTMAELFQKTYRLPRGAVVRDFWAAAATPEITALLLSERTGEVRENVLVFCNDVLLAHLNGADTPLSDGDELFIMLSDVTGG